MRWRGTDPFQGHKRPEGAGVHRCHGLLRQCGRGNLVQPGDFFLCQRNISGCPVLHCGQQPGPHALVPANQSWDDWFEGPGVSKDFMNERHQPEDQVRDIL